MQSDGGLTAMSKSVSPIYTVIHVCVLLKTEVIYLQIFVDS